ncbi:hypothetical protein SAMN05421837_102791 [Amycolatopsis pretoriensis]|uniref:TetR family transcriptional regulator n=1 Tax=Amycolatopsis pretoriensis TaxID=218821 RepID=A0A1H5QET0_9PSEU|nr:hypothetical protein [Amycolatopsis pretoriensis]SEF24620.1 hypothetical protein SAMN05421837_102791 [Amycolatopsis pretoriensis]
MRTWITDTARDLLDHPPPGGPLTLDEIAACASITTHHLRAYYSSVEAIVADIPARPSQRGR